ncbi:MAG TPA: phosphate-starvation-inducible PsiE family protein [Armatimonadota bacterium]|nr:phosphate-starvation-inducible PsiE family protein [Armatimonadota bacterium]
MEKPDPNSALLIEDALRIRSARTLNAIEVFIYAVLGLMLSGAAIIALAGAGHELLEDSLRWTDSIGSIEAVERLLFVLMLVEILHTVRISIKSHHLVTEPFLIVAIIASVRRMLVITMEGSTLTQPTRWPEGGESIFRASLLEMGILGGLVLILVIAIVLMRRYGAQDGDDGEGRTKDEG